MSSIFSEDNDAPASDTRLGFTGLGSTAEPASEGLTVVNTEPLPDDAGKARPAD